MDDRTANLEEEKLTTWRTRHRTYSGSPKLQGLIRPTTTGWHKKIQPEKKTASIAEAAAAWLAAQTGGLARWLILWQSCRLRQHNVCAWRNVPV